MFTYIKNDNIHIIYIYIKNDNLSANHLFKTEYISAIPHKLLHFLTNTAN